MKTKTREQIDEWWDSSVYDSNKGEVIDERRDNLLRSEYSVSEDGSNIPGERDETSPPLRRETDREFNQPLRRDADRELEESKNQSEFI